MKLWLIEFMGSDDYNYVNAAVVRASSEDMAWLALQANAEFSPYFRHQYRITHLTQAGDPEVIIQDAREG